MICYDYDYYNSSGKSNLERIHLIYCIQDSMTY